MLITIPDVLTVQEMSQARAALDAADWVDGKVTAGYQAQSVKDNLQLRLVAAKTLTYPDFGQLNPSLSLNPGTINRAGVASSGNPDLKPIRSNNYDASLEWYFAPASYVSGSVFYRDINGYIQNYVTDVTIGGQPFQLNSPQSAGSFMVRSGWISCRPRQGWRSRSPGGPM